MAIRLRFGTGVGFSTLGAQLMERRDARRAARRARREAMEFQAQQAEIARETAAEQAAAGREAQAAAAAQQQAAAFQRTGLQVAGAAQRQQAGLEAGQEAAVQGQVFKTGQEALRFAIDKNMHSPSQLSRMVKIRADIAHVPTDRSLSPEQQATALQTLQTEFDQIWENPAGELKKKEPTPQQDFEMNTLVFEGVRYTRDSKGVWKKIHEEKPDPAEATATAAQQKRVGDLRKDLTKLEAERRAYMKSLESQTVKVGKTQKRRYDPGTVKRMAFWRFRDAITEKQLEIDEAQMEFGAPAGEEFFEEQTPLEGTLQRAEVPAPIEAPPGPPPPSPFVAPEGQPLPPEAQAALGVQAAGARIPQTPQEIKGSPEHAIQAFRQLTPELVQTLPPDAQRAYQLVQQRMETFMAEPGRAKVFGLQDMPFELRAMIAAIVAIAQGETSVRRPPIAQ